jgi:hypothetical protein
LNSTSWLPIYLGSLRFVFRMVTKESNDPFEREC